MPPPVKVVELPEMVLLVRVMTPPTEKIAPPSLLVALLLIKALVVGELFGRGVRVHGAVAVDEHPVGQAHEEHARHDRHTGLGLDDLERRADGVGGGCGQGNTYRRGA